MRVSDEELVGRGVVVGPEVVHLRPGRPSTLVCDLHGDVVLAHRHRHLQEERRKKRR